MITNYTSQSAPYHHQLEPLRRVHSVTSLRGEVCSIFSYGVTRTPETEGKEVSEEERILQNRIAG